MVWHFQPLTIVRVRRRAALATYDRALDAVRAVEGAKHRTTLVYGSANAH